MVETTGNAILQVRQLHKDYAIGPRLVHVLKGAGFTLDTGEFVAITGISGSGKTTLLHIVGLVDSPTAGAVFLEGEEITALPERRREQIRNRSFGFVFQFYHLLPEFTALENTMMPGFVARKSSGPLKRKARDLLGRVGLGERLRHYPNQLSGGERQRVAIARALINDPAVLLCDEPTGNLDEETGGTIIDLLEELHRESHRTLVLVTHDRQVASHADRTLILHDGLISYKAVAPGTSTEQSFDS